MEDKFLNVMPLIPIPFRDSIPNWYYFVHANEKCYFQKFNSSDTTTVQIITDSENFTVKLKNFETNETEKTFSTVETGQEIIDENFKIYNVDINFASISEPYHYIEIEWEDGAIFSEPIHISEKHDNTILFEYKNSENKFSVIFSNDFVFKFRVEGTLQDFTPSSDDEIYNDQRHSPTLLFSQPFRKFNLYIGGAGGVPDWVSDKVNRIMSCDMVAIDGYFFNKEEGSTWEINRQEEYPFSGMTLSVIPNDDDLNKTFEVEEDDDGDGDVEGEAVINRKCLTFNRNGDFDIQDIFNSNILLDYITVIKDNEAGVFTLKVGTYPGGQNVGEFEIIHPSTTLTIRHNFSNNVTLHLSGINGDCKFHVVFEEYRNIGAGSGEIPEVMGGVPKNAIMVYGGSNTKFNQDFYTKTGLGNEGTEWYGYAICNGSNGTPNLTNRFVYGWHGLGDIGRQTGGSETHKLTAAEMPRHRHNLEDSKRIYVHSRSFKGDSGSDRPLKDSVGDTFLIGTDFSGGDEPHNNMPPYIRLAYVMKII